MKSPKFILSKSVIYCTQLAKSFSHHGNISGIMDIFEFMVNRKVKFDSSALSTLLTGCANANVFEGGCKILGFMRNHNLAEDMFVKAAVLNFFIKCGYPNIALSEWGKIFTEGKVIPDHHILCLALTACANLAAKSVGDSIYEYIQQNHIKPNIILETSLINMYAKVGSLSQAESIFQQLQNQCDVAVWNTMIAAYGQHGDGRSAISLFEKMVQKHRPNEATFVSLLFACSHSGLIDKALYYYNVMLKNYDVSPTLLHKTCVIDALGRVGKLDEAENWANNMDNQDIVVWTTLLGACRIHNDVERAERVAKHALSLDPKNASIYVLLGNIYAASGKWDAHANIRNLMAKRGIQKMPGQTHIELFGQVHSFTVADKSHPEAHAIYGQLEEILHTAYQQGYVPDTNFALHDVGEEEKEQFLSFHSEKLAIAYGMLHTPAGTPITITKNLRVCGDCHNLTKLISKVYKRELVARDANRFHYFKDGKCSCGDYW